MYYFIDNNMYKYDFDKQKEEAYSVEFDANIPPYEFRVSEDRNIYYILNGTLYKLSEYSLEVLYNKIDFNTSTLIKRGNCLYGNSIKIGKDVKLKYINLDNGPVNSIESDLKGTVFNSGNDIICYQLMK